MNLIERQHEIIDMYDNYMSIRAIAKTLGCSPSGVKRILHKNKVAMRNKCQSLNLCPKEFTNEEFDMVYGTILGDGHITKRRGPGCECQLYVGHGQKQSEYLNFKYNTMSRFVSGRTYKLYHTLKNGKTYQTVNFITRKNPLFSKLRDEFYPNDIKILPDNFEEIVNERILAIWYMDDGYKYKNKNNLEIHTQNFSHDDQIRIIKTLKAKFGIESHIRTLRTRQEIIFIPSKSCKKFLSSIDEYIIPSMRYKTLSPEAITPDTTYCLGGKDRVRADKKLSEIV